MRRRSIRISFDTFMAKSRPGLELGEDEKENVEMTAQRIAERRKEKQFGNVRRRNNSLSDKQKIEKKKTALRTKSLTLTHWGRKVFRILAFFDFKFPKKHI